MGMFTRLFGGKVGAAERSARLAEAANLSAPQPGRPSFAVAVPKEVTVAFHAHDHVEGLLGNFLTATSDGLTSSGQRELVLSMRLGTRESPLQKMQEIVRFMTTVHAWARAGNLVDEGGLTRFGDRGLFGRPHSALLYADARAIEGVALPEHALAAIAVDAQEASAAVDFGIYRVLTRIGAQLRMYPFPAWGALDRPSAMTPRESESLLARVPRMRVKGASFLFVEPCLRLTLPSEAVNLNGVASLPSDSPFAFLMRPAPDANAILVWRPGQREMSGITPEGSDGTRMSGSFVLFTKHDEADQARPFEDGYSLRLSADSWALLVAAITEKRPLRIALTSGMRFELDWS